MQSATASLCLSALRRPPACHRCCSTAASAPRSGDAARCHVKPEPIHDASVLRAADHSVRAWDPLFAAGLFRPRPTDKAAVRAPRKNYTLATYVNESDALQRLVALGVDLAQLEAKPGAANIVVHLHWEKDVVPMLHFLHGDVGMPVHCLGDYITRNPWIFRQERPSLRKRLNYLIGKRFSKEAIGALCYKSRYWLNYEETQIDALLGWFQQQFALSGDQVRFLAVKEPRLITMGVGNVKILVLRMSEEFGFTSGQMKKILLTEPRVFLTTPLDLQRTLAILQGPMKLPLEAIVAEPVCLRCRPDVLSVRHAFLFSLYRAQYDCEKPNYVPLSRLVTLGDKQFAEEIGKVPVQVLDRFMMKQ